MESSSSSGAMEVECTICMESTSEETVLPCKCKLHYCLPCWDKALANSFIQCGQARCPSCRSLVRVDFDAEKQCLVFSPEAIDMTFIGQTELIRKIQQEYRESREENQSSEESFRQFLEMHEDFETVTGVDQMRQDSITRLRHQAQPAQVKLLEQYAKANPSFKEVQENASDTLAKASAAELKRFAKAASVDTQGCLEKSDLIALLVEKVDATSLGCIWASQKCSEPAAKCVCGSSFQRVDGVERYKNSLGDRARNISDEDIERRLQQCMSQGHSIVICDICEENVPLAADTFVWTCDNRNSTILHATSFDICDKCFVDSACSRKAEKPTE